MNIMFIIILIIIELLVAYSLFRIYSNKCIFKHRWRFSPEHSVKSVVNNDGNIIGAVEFADAKCIDCIQEVYNKPYNLTILRK